MNDELTREDIRKMQEELDYRRLELMPELIEEVKRTRAFGDLSENFEYKAAKQAQNKNRSRIRYLEGMIKTARIIDDRSEGDSVGLFDEVEIYMPDEDETEIIRVVTTVRCDPRKGLISRESPFGKQVLGKKVGDRFTVQVNEHYSYQAENTLAAGSGTSAGSGEAILTGEGYTQRWSVDYYTDGDSLTAYRPS